MPTVHIFLASGCEEIETLAVADVLVRAGCTVRLGAHEGTQLRGSRGLPLAADCSLDQLLPQPCDLVYLPGGLPQAAFCRQDPRIQALLAQRLGAQLPTAIICASPTALIPQGLAKGRRLTSFPKLADELRQAGAQWVDAPVVEDANLITSQGPGTAIALGLALAERLCGAATAQSVAAGLLVPYEGIPCV